MEESVVFMTGVKGAYNFDTYLMIEACDTKEDLAKQFVKVRNRVYNIDRKYTDLEIEYNRICNNKIVKLLIKLKII